MELRRATAGGLGAFVSLADGGKTEEHRVSHLSGTDSPPFLTGDFLLGFLLLEMVLRMAALRKRSRPDTRCRAQIP